MIGADINGDGIQEILTTQKAARSRSSSSNKDLIAFHYNKTGYTVSDTLLTLNTPMRDLNFFDMNKDGYQDLVFTIYSAEGRSIHWMKRNPNGSLGKEFVFLKDLERRSSTSKAIRKSIWWGPGRLFSTIPEPSEGLCPEVAPMTSSAAGPGAGLRFPIRPGWERGNGSGQFATEGKRIGPKTRTCFCEAIGPAGFSACRRFFSRTGRVGLSFAR